MTYKEASSRSYGQLIMTIVGSFTVISGVVLVIFWPRIFDNILFKQIALQPGSKSYGYWISPPQPMFLDIYLFNWTNSQDFTNKSIKPNFVEVGPFRFQEIPRKVNVTFHSSNSTVSYRKQSRYFFVADQSKGKLDDIITSVNVIALSAANRVKHGPWIKTKGVSFGLTMYGEKVFVTKNASEWLFDGYEDPMINLAKGNPLLDAGDIPFDRFGWFYMRNDSSLLLGDFNANTGTDDISGIGNIRTWNHKLKTGFFEGSCDELSGSSGDFFNPGMTKNQTLELFSPEMCRSVSMDFEEEKDIQGIKTLKYSGGDRTVDNGTLYPENECYCSGECVPSGLFNVSSCRYGTPVFMSFPHFYNADQFYLDQVDGMKPDKEKHQFFMAFEPKTAIPLEVAARFQINILVEPIKSITIFEKAQKKFMPILWFEQHVEMNKDVADEVKMILGLPHVGQMMGVVFIVVGVFQIFLLRTKKMFLKCFCPKHIKASSEFSKSVRDDMIPSPEISPLIQEKPQNGVTLIGNKERNVFRA